MNAIGNREESSAWFEHLKNEIKKTYGHNVVFNRKTLKKFGRSTNFDTTETEINALNQTETYVTDNLITHVSSSSGSDTGDVYYEGMTISGNVFTFTSDTVTLQGQTKTELPTPMARITRGENDSSTDLVGNVYFYEDDTVSSGVPDTAAKRHNLIIATDGTTLRAATSVASGNYFIITKLYAYLNKATNGVADIRLRTRLLGKTFKTKIVASCTTNLAFNHKFDTGLIIPPNTDISMTAKGSTTNLDVSAGFEGYFADIV